MGINEKYTQAQADYDYLIEHHKTEPYDITGGFGEGDFYKKLLRSPTKKVAYEHYVTLIQYSADSGFENLNNDYRKSPDLKDPKTLEIYDRYDCDDVLLSRWDFDLEAAINMLNY